MQTLSVSAGFAAEDQSQLTVGATQVAFPAPVLSISARPERIFVQALAGNTGKIMIGKTGVLANGSLGGYELAAGANMTLPNNISTAYFAIATGAGQLLQVTYLSKVI